MPTQSMKIYSDGRFHINHVEKTSYLYLPLFNKNGMLSVITPNLMGDVKLDQNHFLNPPQSIEDIQHGLSGRHVFFALEEGLFSTSGKTPAQKLANERVDVEIGLVYQTVTRFLPNFTIKTTSFVPTRHQSVELHRTTFTNTSNQVQSVLATIMVPLFSRSADNLRDHRHVTALLNRAKIVSNGIINQPTLSFDERGHLENHHVYGVYSSSSHHDEVSSYWPVMEEFVGEGNDLFYPQVPQVETKSVHQIGDIVEGFEVSAGLSYSKVLLQPNESLDFVYALGIANNEATIHSMIQPLLSLEAFLRAFEETKADWQKEPILANIELQSEAVTGWFKWVNLQPLMRRIYGNSFLPFHDYGRGGRGWRDLWQDLLAQIFVEPSNVKEAILNNVAGIRIDGSNATIIGHKPGEFVADRNKIVRVWSDHGAWGVLTTDLYIQRTGDDSILLEKRGFFQDKFTHYTHAVYPAHALNDQPILLDQKGNPYESSVLEHFLIQNVVPFFNVGKHGNLRLEDADWNDGLDMAKEEGETIAFTAFYAGNYRKIANWLKVLQAKGHQEIILTKEFAQLFRQANGQGPDKLQTVLQIYFDQVAPGVSGETEVVKISECIDILLAMAAKNEYHLQNNEFLQKDNLGFYRGYYDKHGKSVESIDQVHPMMTLTPQVFTLMAQVATKDQIQQMKQAVQTYLYDESVLGIRLNTPFLMNLHDLGRLVGFAYGHKENGAPFSHMSVMYAYSLFLNNETKAGVKVLDDMMTYCMDFQRSKMYPGIPEYIDTFGRGVYPFLTGSASWYILTFIEQVFGLGANQGNLVIQPRLQLHHFMNHQASVEISLDSKRVKVVFHNPNQCEEQDYIISSVQLQNQIITVNGKRVEITKAMLGSTNEIHVHLGPKQKNIQE